MSPWIVPAIVVWTIVLVLLSVRFFGRFGDASYWWVIRRVDGWANELSATAADFFRPMRRHGNELEELRPMAARYLTGLGGFAAVLFGFGLLLSILGIGTVGTLILMLFPGSFMASRVYTRIVRQ